MNTQQKKVLLMVITHVLDQNFRELERVLFSGKSKKAITYQSLLTDILNELINECNQKNNNANK